ncbi:chorismate mutase [Amycolatopsis sp. NPDC051903]|uniref:chorismate mutase n=1 Tax=Amycolatopsis sp. NPDC051903 TaxID=3363936 RepID=UPI0037A783D3
MPTFRRLTVALAVLVPLTTLTSPVAGAAPAAGAADQLTSAPLDQLIGAVVERLQTGDTVAAAKWPTRGPIEDPAREKVVLDAASAGATERGLDPAGAVAVFGDQIAASKTVQYGLFSDWTANPEHAPTTIPDLSQIRPILDRITGELLDGMVATKSLRTSAVCGVAVRLSAERASLRTHFDQLHRTALDRAVRSLCE